MPANIMQRALFRKTAAWHKLGIVISEQEHLTATQAFVRSRQTFEFKKAPLLAEINGEYHPVPEVGIFREPINEDPSWRHISTVSPAYGLLQIADLGKLIDPLSEKWPVETCGSLGLGETQFMTLRFPSYDVGGDQVERYFLLSDSKKGNEAVHIGITHIRVVCQNTLSAALADRRSQIISLPHFSTIKQDLESLRDIMAQMEEQQHQISAAFQHMAAKQIVDAQVDEIIAAAYRMPVRKSREQLLAEEFGNELAQAGLIQSRIEGGSGGENAKEHEVTLQRRAVKTLYTKLSDEFPAIAGTPWAAYNAVAEYADMPRGRVKNMTPRLAEAVLWGSRALERNNAFKKAAELAGVN